MTPANPIPLLTPGAQWRYQQLEPQASAYLTRDDYLAVSVYTTISTTALALAYRYQDIGGTQHYGRESLDGVTTSVFTTKLFPLSEGFMLGVTVSNLGSTLADQLCWVVIALQRSGQGSTPPHTVLAQGYVSNLLSVNWPPSLARGPATSGLAAWPALANDPARPPVSPNAMDDEFDGGTLNLAKWTWWDQRTATGVLSNSRLTMLPGAAAVNALAAIEQTIPATPSTYIIGRVAREENSGVPVGLFLRDSVGGKALSYGASANTGQHHFDVRGYNSDGTYATYNVGGFDGVRYSPCSMAVQVTNAALNFLVSDDGINYHQTYTQAPTAFLANAPNRVGIAMNVIDGGNYVSIDYFRRTL